MSCTLSQGAAALQTLLGARAEHAAWQSGLPLVVSDDTRRPNRVPPNQSLTRNWPALHACEYGFSTNLPFDDFLGEDCLFAWKADGQDLEPGPRLAAAPGGAEAVRVEERQVGARHRTDGGDRPGFWESWENGGYHMRGDPWTEERFQDR